MTNIGMKQLVSNMETADESGVSIGSPKHLFTVSLSCESAAGCSKSNAGAKSSTSD